MSQIVPTRHENVPSPFCGIGSEDLVIEVSGESVRILEHGDAVTSRGFETPISDRSPRVDGREASLDEAIARIAERLTGARLPVFSGFGTDVADTRAALSLIDRTRGIFDQASSNAGLRNLLVLSDSGWMVTTLAEVRNRMDLLVVFGTDIEAPFPRFFERFVWPSQTLFDQDPKTRKVIFLGKPPSGKAAVSPLGVEPEIHACEKSALPLVSAALAALAKGVTLDVETVGGIPLAVLESIVERLRSARYGVVAWAAGQIDCPHAELTIQRLTQAIVSLNATTRCMGLPLGGQDGDRTASQVCAWLTGYPTRVSFQRGYPEYDPYHHSAERLLARGEADVLVWVSSEGLTPPPKTSVPTLVLARSGMVFSTEPEVFIPVGVPGIDFRGQMYRCDNVVAMPLHQIRKTSLPRAAEVLKAIEAAVSGT